jgi:hypothetical protein
MKRYYLDVPFTDKNRAKLVGCKWEYYVKSWYTTTHVEDAFHGWRLKNNQDDIEKLFLENKEIYRTTKSKKRKLQWDEDDYEDDYNECVCHQCSQTNCVCYQLIEDAIDTEETEKKECVQKESDADHVPKEAPILFETSDEMNCLHTYLMEKMRDHINVIWAKFGSLYGISVFNAAFQIDLIELKLAYEMETNIKSFVYKGHAMEYHHVSYAIEGLLRLEPKMVNSTMIVRFSKI